MNLADLKDIKPYAILSIDKDMYIASVVFLVLLLVLLIVLFKKRNTHKSTTKQKATALLKTLNFNTDDKTLIYDWTIYGKIIASKNDKKFYDILEQLEPYKYKKETIKLDQTIKNKMQKYIESLS